MKLALLISMTTILFVASLPLMAATPAELLTVGQNIPFYSTLQQQERLLTVYVPEDHDSSSEACPVMFLLDGQIRGLFLNAVAAVEHLADAGRGPQMILVGVHAGDTRSDYFPYPVERVPGSGEADTFLECLTTEIAPFIDSCYRANGYRILAGGSNAGLFTAWTALSSPEAFSAFIAVSPSIGWSVDSMAALAAARLSDPAYSPPPIYMCYSDDDIAGIVLKGAPEFFEIFEREPAGRDCRRLEMIPGGGHVPFAGLYHGLGLVFDGWKMSSEEAATAGLSDVADYYRLLGERFGFDIKIPAGSLMDLGIRHYRDEQWDAATGVFDRYAQLYPSSTRARFFLGASYERQGDTVRAVASYRDCLELDPGHARARVKLQQLTPAKSTADPDPGP